MSMIKSLFSEKVTKNIGFGVLSADSLLNSTHFALHLNIGVELGLSENTFCSRSTMLSAITGTENFLHRFPQNMTTPPHSCSSSSKAPHTVIKVFIGMPVCHTAIESS